MPISPANSHVVVIDFGIVACHARSLGRILHLRIPLGEQPRTLGGRSIFGEVVGDQLDFPELG